MTPTQKYREALYRFCKGKQRMCVPAQKDDDDMVLSEAIDLIEQKDSEIEQLKDQRNRALAEWGKTIEDAEIIEGANKQLMDALKLIKYAPSSHSYSRVIADDVLTRLGEPE